MCVCKSLGADGSLISEQNNAALSPSFISSHSAFSLSSSLFSLSLSVLSGSLSPVPASASLSDFSGLVLGKFSPDSLPSRTNLYVFSMRVFERESVCVRHCFFSSYSQQLHKMHPDLPLPTLLPGLFSPPTSLTLPLSCSPSHTHTLQEHTHHTSG